MHKDRTMENGEWNREQQTDGDVMDSPVLTSKSDLDWVKTTDVQRQIACYELH